MTRCFTGVDSTRLGFFAGLLTGYTIMPRNERYSKVLTVSSKMSLEGVCVTIMSTSWEAGETKESSRRRLRHRRLPRSRTALSQNKLRAPTLAISCDRAPRPRFSIKRQPRWQHFNRVTCILVPSRHHHFSDHDFARIDPGYAASFRDIHVDVKFGNDTLNR
jgi:hypothetical protein